MGIGGVGDYVKLHFVFLLIDLDCPKRSYHIRKTRWRILWNYLMCPSSKDFLMVHIQKGVWKSNFNVSYSDSGRGYLMASPLKGFAPINELKEVLIRIRFNIVHRYQDSN